ncbi:MAG TPA: VOC family protein [Labilithrix sp.]|jgi:uncharacterized glyoxalase superfamily protein PhnB/DNA-binding XRE family transcriptional regulator
MPQLDIGKKIRALREKKAWTQDHLAQAAGISLRTVQRAEEGAMSAETLSALAAAFDLMVEELTHDETAYPSVTPMIPYDDGTTVDWLVRAFGFGVRMKIPGPRGQVVHGELTIGTGLVMVSAPSHEEGWQTPKTVGTRTQIVYVMVDDADAHYAHAKSAGAKILTEPHDAHGHRRYLAEDPEGHRWWFASPVR